MTPVDQRRLNDGARAMQESETEPTTRAEAMYQMTTLSIGIAALQSLDDLGSQANQKAWDDMLKLQERYYALKDKWEPAP